ncbi:MAG TPA: histidinol dehydrogenase, partial [Pseudolabrys sp.]|nr:histidinol dehydrogenase [Pseudolabrys sp.]
MAIEYLKRASKTAATGEADVRATVAAMLAEIEADGEAKAADYARRLDKWDGDIVVSRELRARAAEKVPAKLKDDIRFAHDKVRSFATAQRAAIQDVEIELMPGLIAGHKNIPVATAGCYVPGGRYAHVASAIMSVTTAKVAGVENVIACSPPKPGVGINPAVLYALDLCGADTILNLGGVQGVAALAFGLFSGHAADILVGPGNQFVAEAKRILYGRVGIDMFAGPSEILVIADASADPEIVAADLVGQAEHGFNSPAWLIALSRDVAEQVLELVPKLIAALP